MFIKDSSVWCTGLWRPCRQSLLTAHLTRWPRAALLPLPAWLLLHTKDLPTEARSLIIASRKQLQPYSSQDRRTNRYLLQARKKLNPFGGYGCTRTSLLTGSRSCFPLYRVADSELDKHGAWSEPFHPSLWLLDEGGREQAESNCGKALGRLCKDIFLITQCLCKPSAIKILLKVLARRTSPLENDTYKKSLPKQIVAWVPEMEKRFDGWEGNIKMSPHIRKQNESNHQNLSAREKQSVFLALKRPDILNQNQNTGSQKKEKDVFAI